MRHATILVAILAFAPIASTAQETSMAQVPLRPGERVGVTYHLCPPTLANCFGGRALRVGTLVTWNADTLVVDNNGDTLAVPLDIVTELKVSRRLGLSRNGAAKGAAIGGVLLYAVSRSPAASAFGAGVGALLGSGPGSPQGSRDRVPHWRTRWSWHRVGIWGRPARNLLPPLCRREGVHWTLGVRLGGFHRRLDCRSGVAGPRMGRRCPRPTPRESRAAA